ncbi:DNA polyermase [Psittacine adenovirus 3]|uniref:DNA polymerase n=1 Tax=Psittacine adenovirus 3 TaxID=1580497 RepID=A0A5C0PVH6_9ADEN|nr:DNA polyermase [Psittacine adenovirus 3]
MEAAQSTTVGRLRSTKEAYGKLDGEYIKVTYFNNTAQALKNYCALNRIPFSPKTLRTPADISRCFTTRGPSAVAVYTLSRGTITRQELTTATQEETEPLSVLVKNKQLHLVKNIKTQQRCEDCLTYFQHRHVCRARKREYVQHLIKPDTRQMWEVIKFSPVGSPPSTRRLYVVYDIETYTYHSSYGKQLLPYLLAFSLMGDSELVQIAQECAKEAGFVEDRCFYILSAKADVIGTMFKAFRQQLQMTVAHTWWAAFCRDQDLPPDTEISFAQLESMHKEGKLVRAQPSFIEIIVVGHNITGFDEIVLASHVLEGIRKEQLPMFDIRRNFLPRAGKLLFNDVFMAVPNPTYERPTADTFRRWKSGAVEAEDMKFQGIKFMVRDTFLLTHSSLRQAAKAYNLDVAKGYCPYEAINDYFRTGRYEAHANGYPGRRYWQSDAEYRANKPQADDTYDLLAEATKYCIEDVLVTASLVRKLSEGYQQFCSEQMGLNCSFHVFSRPTISSNTHALFKQCHYAAEDNPRTYLPNIQAPSMEMYDHVRESVRGGRCYPSVLGLVEEAVYVYDICGMYASALTHPMPYGRTLDTLSAGLAMRYLQHLLDADAPISYFHEAVLPMIVRIDALPPPLERLDTLPPLCSRRGGRLCWTNEQLIGEVVTSIDIVTLHNRGWKVTIVPDAYNSVWSSWKCICREYVKLNIEAKEKADREGNQVIRSISKLLSNALYGSFATRIDNKQVIFENDLTEDVQRRITSGKAEKVSQTTVISRSLPKLETWRTFFSYLPESSPAEDFEDDARGDGSGAFIGEAGHVTFKPFSVLEPECDDLVLSVVEDRSPWTKNCRYPTQIASFVLAWTRAFTSEWADILFSDSRDTPYWRRPLIAVYGDTDSLFVTERGRQLMESRGAHRLKKNNSRLVFDPSNPCLTWVADCETVCSACGGDAYAPESVYLAPKLYGLQKTVCRECGKEGSGKLRAKGHAKDCITYDRLKSCFLDYHLMEQPDASYQTERRTIKKTLSTGNRTNRPFTVVEQMLRRTLRPWTDKTMRSGAWTTTNCLLYPYDVKHPNPRTDAVLTENPFWDDT